MAFSKRVCDKIAQEAELLHSCSLSRDSDLGAVHILRQPPEGGGGVSQMLTIVDKGGGANKGILCEEKCC